MKFFKFSLILILLNSCANIVYLTGGKDDTEIPILIKKNFDSINFNQKKIELKFNEYVTLNQPEKNITLQPSHSTLKFKTIQKSIIIELDSELRKNTTYVLNIENGIQDNNANNPFSYSTVFSTGNTIDTGLINVNILNDINQLKNIKIALSNNDGLDSFKTFKADYIYPVKSNQIRFKGLSDKKYNIWLFSDDDNNNIPDVYKPIDFRLNALIDSNYTLLLKEWKKPLYIKNLKIDKEHQKCLFNQTISDNDSTFILDYLGININDIVYITSDSIMMKLNENKLQNFIKKNQKRIIKIDSSIINSQKESKELVKSSIQIIKRKKDYIIKYKELKNIELKELVLNKLDSFIIINNDTLNLKNVSIKDYKNLCYLDFKINSIKKFDLYFYLDKKLVYVKKYDNQIMNYFMPGKYEIKIFENDKNYPNNPFENNVGANLILTKEIILKANWDEVLSLSL